MRVERVLLGDAIEVKMRQSSIKQPVWLLVLNTAECLPGLSVEHATEPGGFAYFDAR